MYHLSKEFAASVSAFYPRFLSGSPARIITYGVTMYIEPYLTFMYVEFLCGARAGLVVSVAK